MEVGIVALATGIVGLITVMVKYLLSPDAKEAKKQEEKRALDEAIREGDTDDMSALLSEQFDRLHKDSDNTRQPPVISSF